ncbi:uncharacterized protein LOC121384115 isoform X4 [Gigantopelta aegis]|uniref:uncharacterized protein LOC121384115 isoform X4 n=1 Tax=Gigantopelta aegis TaxID=1735272 RepID=UPI001B888B18|nr:uncharacterized protein LOC121384115 isoform X4 [Gigantopelta aegis]
MHIMSVLFRKKPQSTISMTQKKETNALSTAKKNNTNAVSNSDKNNTNAVRMTPKNDTSAVSISQKNNTSDVSISQKNDTSAVSISQKNNMSDVSITHKEDLKSPASITLKKDTTCAVGIVPKTDTNSDARITPKQEMENTGSVTRRQVTKSDLCSTQKQDRNSNASVRRNEIRSTVSTQVHITNKTFDSKVDRRADSGRKKGLLSKILLANQKANKQRLDGENQPIPLDSIHFKENYSLNGNRSKMGFEEFHRSHYQTSGCGPPNFPSRRGNVYDHRVPVCERWKSEEEASHSSSRYFDHSSTRTFSRWRSEDDVSYPSQLEEDVSYPSQCEDHISYPSHCEDDVSYPSQHEDDVSYPSQREDDVSYPSQREDDVSYPSQREDDVSYQQCKDDVSYSSQHEDDVSYPSQRKDNVSYPSQHEDDVSYPSQREDDVSYPSQCEDTRNHPWTYSQSQRREIFTFSARGHYRSYKSYDDKNYLYRDYYQDKEYDPEYAHGREYDPKYYREYDRGRYPDYEYDPDYDPSRREYSRWEDNRTHVHPVTKGTRYRRQQNIETTPRTVFYRHLARVTQRKRFSAFRCHSRLVSRMSDTRKTDISDKQASPCDMSEHLKVKLTNPSELTTIESELEMAGKRDDKDSTKTKSDQKAKRHVTVPGDQMGDGDESQTGESIALVLTEMDPLVDEETSTKPEHIADLHPSTCSKSQVSTTEQMLEHKVPEKLEKSVGLVTAMQCLQVDETNKMDTSSFQSVRSALPECEKSLDEHESLDNDHLKGFIIPVHVGKCPARTSEKTYSCTKNISKNVPLNSRNIIKLTTDSDKKMTLSVERTVSDCDIQSHLQSVSEHDIQFHLQSVSDHDIPSHLQSISDHDIQSHLQSVSDHDIQSHLQSDSDHDIQSHLQSDSDHDIQSHLQSVSDHDIQSHLQSVSDHDIQSHFQSDSDHDIQSHHQSVSDHDIQSHLQSVSDHDIQSHLQSDSDHDIQFHLQTENTNNSALEDLEITMCSKTKNTESIPSGNLTSFNVFDGSEDFIPEGNTTQKSDAHKSSSVSDGDLSSIDVESDDDSVDELLNETPAILQSLEQRCNRASPATPDCTLESSQLSDDDSLDLQIATSPVHISKPAGTSKSGFSLDFLLAEKIEKEEENRELDIMHAELKEGIKKGGFAKLTFDSEDGNEGDLLPEYQQKLHHFKVSKSVIEDVHPGDQVFSADHFQQLFTERILPPSCGFVSSNTTIDKHLFTIEPALVCDLVNTNTLSLCFHAIASKDAMLRWLFFLLSIHSSSVLLHGCKKVLFDILHTQHCSDKTTTWTPDILDILRVFVNYGAKAEDLMLGQTAFTEEQIRKAFEAPSDGNVQQNIPNVNAYQRLNQENISMVIQTISYALQGRPKYKTEELNCLLVMVLKVALDTALNNSALDYDLQVCVASILENYGKEEWPEMIPDLCLVLSGITKHHHNKVHMAQLLPNGKRGRYVQRRLSYVFLRQLLFPSNCLTHHSELVNLQVRTLSGLFHHICDLASEDLYALASAITLLDMSVGNECLKSSEKVDLDYLTGQLKFLMSDVRDNVRMLDKTRVKDMMVRVSSKWTLMMHAMGSKQKSLFAWAKERNPQTMTVERLETGLSDQETEVSDQTDDDDDDDVDVESPQQTETIHSDVHGATCVDETSGRNLAETEPDTVVETESEAVLETEPDTVVNVFLQNESDTDEDDIIMLSDDSNEEDDDLPDPNM